MRDDFSPTNLGNAPINYDPRAYNRIVKNVELLLNTLRQPGPINVTTITTSGSITIGGDATIEGDLTVNGTINGGGGPWLPLAGGVMDTGATIGFGSSGGDKVYWYADSYGTGIESGTLTSWANQHRWRTGGTSVSSGTERMLLSSTALTLTGNLAVSGTSEFSSAISLPNATASTGISLSSGTTETRIGSSGVFAREGGTIIFRPNGSGSSSNQATLTTSGTLAAVLFSGSGASLTNLDASNLSSGTIPNARFPATLPAASGANLTNLNASNLSSGTVPSARVSGAYTNITSVGTLSADLDVIKSSAVIGVGVSGTRNGGMRNLGSAGDGWIGIYSEFDNGRIYLRPNSGSANQAILWGSTGLFQMPGEVSAGSLTLASGSPALTISTSTNQTQIGSSGIFARNGGIVYLRPNGVGDSTGQVTLNTSGNMVGTGSLTFGSFSGASASLGSISGDTLTLTGNVQDFGVIGRTTSNPWSFRWNGTSGNIYVGGTGNNDFTIATNPDVSTNRVFYVGINSVISYAGHSIVNGIFPSSNSSTFISAQYTSASHTVPFYYRRNFDSATTSTICQFDAQTGLPATVGSVTSNGSSVSYNTSSDYRLKVNYEEMASVRGRVDAIPVYRGEFISDPGKVVDYFIAHEVQDHVPEAVHGDKDAVDDNDNPIYQGIDQSKLVPLHHGALKELYALIDSLTDRVSELEAQLAGE